MWFWSFSFLLSHFTQMILQLSKVQKVEEGVEEAK